MFSFFKKRTKPDPRDLEQIIYDVAEHHREDDIRLFYRLMAAREVFIPIDMASVPDAARSGVPYVVGAADPVAIKTIVGPDNQTWASAATQPTHPLLSGGYAGMPWLEFLKMVLKLEAVHGALLQGQTSWIALDRERIAYVLTHGDAA